MKNILKAVKKDLHITVYFFGELCYKQQFLRILNYIL